MFICAAAHAQDPPPGAAAQQAILDGVRGIAQRYQAELPDFICTLLTKRFEDQSGKGQKFKQRDTDEVEFRNLGHVWSRGILKVNGKPARSERLAGFYSDALVLRIGFLPDWLLGPGAKTKFEWARWDQQAGQRVAVFRLDEPPSETQWGITSDRGSIKVGLHGYMYVDPAAGRVIRLELEMEIPPNTLLDAVAGSFDLDYGSVFIAGQEFFLPVRTVAQIRTASDVLSKNETEVVRYQKYTADSSVRFGDSDR